ncbi:MAG TPA: vWA domain-containing protein [Chloroflexia bacterium]|nr:vWA domain-containing protein [Chloroflexia bacterium]
MKKQPFIKVTLFILVCFCFPMLLAACGSYSVTTAPAGTTAAATTAVDSGDSSAEETKPGTSGLPTGAASATTAAATTAAAGTTSAAAGSSAVRPSPYNQTPLKAGAVDDNLKFQEYLDYIRSYQDEAVLPVDVSERYIISVIDGDARTVSNAAVKIYGGQQLLFEGKTYSNGQVLFFPRAIAGASQFTRFDVTVEKAGQSTTRSFQRLNLEQSQDQSAGTTWSIELKGSLHAQPGVSPTLDLLFLLDSTGSMGGEIRQVQQTISEISYQINELPGAPKVRFGVVTYRDRGDNYVTRKYGFTSNLGEFSNFLNSISAGGGGDYPESLDEALDVAIKNMNWDAGNAVRLTFLVADAPPHLDYPDDVKYTRSVVEAVRQGIKIYTIGASGLSKQGEYIFRQLSELTLAQYLFITRGGDEGKPGSGGPASNTGVTYQEKNLAQIVINIVRSEVTNLAQ